MCWQFVLNLAHDHFTLTLDKLFMLNKLRSGQLEVGSSDVAAIYTPTSSGQASRLGKQAELASDIGEAQLSEDVLCPASTLPQHSYIRVVQ